MIWYAGGLGVVISTVLAGVVRLGAVVLLTEEYVYEVDIRWTVLVTYSTGVVLLLASQAVEGAFELTTVQYALLLVGFVVAYLVSNISLIGVNLASPITDNRN